MELSWLDAVRFSPRRSRSAGSFSSVHSFIHYFVAWWSCLRHPARFCSSDGGTPRGVFFFWFCGVGSSVLTSSTSFFGLRKACVMTMTMLMGHFFAQHVPRLSVTDTTTSQEREEPLEHATSYEETRSWGGGRTRSQSQPQPQTRPRPQAPPTLPTQTSRGSSTRSIPPSSSAHTTSPSSHLTSQPTRTRQQSRGSSTFTSLLASTTHASTENTSRATAAASAAARHPISEKPNGENSRRSQTSVQGRAAPKLASLREEHRYCRRCSIIKPPRTHHCRACGTVRPAILFVSLHEKGD